MCHDGKEVNLILIRRSKLNLVSIDQIKNEQIMAVARLKQCQGTHGKARKCGHLPKHIQGVLVGYKDVLTNKFPQKITAKKRTTTLLDKRLSSWAM